MTNQIADASTPTTVTFTVRKYLTEREVEQLMDCARKRSRYGHRDATMILVAYRHGLRASEVCGLEWHQIELDQGQDAHQKGQEWLSKRPSHPWRRDPSLEATKA